MSSSGKERKGKSPSGVADLENSRSASVSDEQKPKSHPKNNYMMTKFERPGPNLGRTKKKTRGDELREKYYRSLRLYNYNDRLAEGWEHDKIVKKLKMINQRGGRKTLRKKRKRTTRKKKN